MGVGGLFRSAPAHTRTRARDGRLVRHTTDDDDALPGGGKPVFAFRFYVLLFLCCENHVLWVQLQLLLLPLRRVRTYY